MTVYPKQTHKELTHAREEHAAAFTRGNLPDCLDLTLSEALVLGLLKQQLQTDAKSDLTRFCSQDYSN
jgi:hypothetical protein